MNLYNLSQAILGSLPIEFNFLYGLLTFILAIYIIDILHLKGVMIGDFIL